MNSKYSKIRISETREKEREGGHDLIHGITLKANKIEQKEM
jgi:hypothetical protein